MPFFLRPPQKHELDEASQLCLRSKAHWGYDQEFMTACKGELTLNEQDLADGSAIVAVGENGLMGVAQVSRQGSDCVLEKLFVDTECMGEGIGRALLLLSLDTARRFNALQLIVEADPEAVPFYRRMGCIDAGKAPSGSIPGRSLPRMIYRFS